MALIFIDLTIINIYLPEQLGQIISMAQTAPEQPTASSRLVSNNQGEPTSRIHRILNQLDIFSYVPEPHTYPVSTTKSKIASVVFLVLVVGYLTYDFVKFMIANQPVINSYDANVPLNKLYQAPEIAFGFIYGSSLNQTLNDPTYFTFSFNSISSTASGNSVNQQKIPVGMIQNCNPEWLGEYNNIYRNLSCLNESVYLMNIPSQNPNSLSQRLSIQSCVPGGQIVCKNATELSKMTSGGRLVLIINLPAGFDYQTGTVEDSDYSVEIYQFFLIPSLYSRISIEYYEFQFTTYPTYFTTWKFQKFSYMQSYEPVVHTSNVTVYNSNVMLSVTFCLFSALTNVQVQYQNIITRVSQWGALASLIMAVFGLCCLTYNKSKFLKTNPTWKNFDEAMRQKEEQVIEIEMQTTNAAKKQNQEEYEQSQSGGIMAIRKKVERNLND